MDLLKETKIGIKNSGHKITDIIFIGSEDGYSCSWNEFNRLADFEYDSGFGSSKIATDLIIVFKDGSKMWRGEYDGSEWWEYSTPFVMPREKKQIITVCNGGMWTTLADMHKIGGKYGDA